MAGFITAEGLIVAAGADTYDYVNDQRRLAGSIRSLVPAADRAAGDTIASAMATDGRPVSGTNPLAIWNQAKRAIEIKDAAGWASTAARRAEWTGTANTGANVAWGLGTMTAGTATNNTFSAAGAASKITLTEAGTYSITIKIGSGSAPGFFYVSIKNDADNVTYADGNNGGGPDWGTTATLNSLLVTTAPTNVLFGLRTANAVAVTATVTIQKTADL